MILAALAATASLSSCTPIIGAERLWASPSVRYVMVGESHGTRETPEFFADLVCAASTKRPVVVAVEQDTAAQPAIDEFMRSRGDVTARKAFVKAIWPSGLEDGRGSEAMIYLFDKLRQYQQSGRIRKVVAFRSPISEDLTPLLGTPDLQRRLDELTNAGMAEQLEEAARSAPTALVLGYAGSVHVSRDAASNFSINSATARLPRAETVAVFVDGEGTGWMGIGGEYGPRPVAGFTQVCESGKRQVTFPAPGAGLPGFDAIGCTGKPFTASPPAVPTQADAHR